MIPYIQATTFSLGPITLQVWGTFVALGFLVGTYIVARRAKKNGLDEKSVWDLAFWLFISAIIGSRVFHVLVYEPGFYLAHPWDALNPAKPGFAIYGGLVSAALVFWIYVKKKKLDFLVYADTVIWGLPWGCGIGRIGCFLIHDHPGTLSSFVGAVKYPDGSVRHDLGLDLSIAGFIIGAFFLLAGLKQRRPGFFLGLFLILDGVTRFWLDFYRIGDVRLLYLTPTQWIAVPCIGIGFWLIFRRKI